MPNAAVVALSAAVMAAAAQEKKPAPPPMMRVYLQRNYDAAALSIDEAKSASDWPRWRAKALQDLRRCLGLEPFPERTPLKPRVVRVLDRVDYTVEKVVFETRPNFLMSGNLYRLKSLRGRAPAVLCLPDCTSGGKTLQETQSRAINYARAGWVALAVDPTGVGERVGSGHHGAFAIVTTGMTLPGVLVWDNIRAVDYLLGRPEVDGGRVGITGASGAGSSTMYTAAIDERLQVAVVVSSVSDLRRQIFTPHGIGCDCQCVPDLMRCGLEDAGVCALIAPRTLLQVNDTGDTYYPIRYARETSQRLTRFYEMIGFAERYKLAEVRSRRTPHGYHGLCRAAAHRWFDRWFNNRPEEIEYQERQASLEMEQDLWCFPSGRLPEDSATLGSLAEARAREQAARLTVPTTAQARRILQARIRDEVLGGFPPRCPLDARETEPVTRQGVTRRRVTLTSEPGITITADIALPKDTGDRACPCVVVVRDRASPEPWGRAEAFLDKGFAVAELALRPLGEDEHVSRAALVLGRPLVGMGAYDLTRFVDYLQTRKDIDGQRVSLWAEDLMTLPALYALALDERIAGATLVGLLTTYVSPTPVPHPTWTFARDLLKHADIEHLAALAAPRPLGVANPVGPDLKPVPPAALPRAFTATRQAYAEPDGLRIIAGDDEQIVAAAVRLLGG